MIAVAIFLMIAMLAFMTVSMIYYMCSTIIKPQFSLQSLLIMVLWVGGCATFLQDPKRELLFAYGVVGVIVFFACLIAFVINGVEAKVEVLSSARKPRSELRNRAVTTSAPSSEPPPACPPSSGGS